MADPTVNVPSGMSSATHQPQPGGRERFSAEELAIVMSHYDIGIIREIREFPRGSRKAPKLLVESEMGSFLLKRRARGRDDANKVAFTHQIQLHLAAQQFPLPHLVGTRRDNNSMLQLGKAIYELFEYIPGQGYPMSLESTLDAGRVLGLFHKLLEDFDANPPSAVTSYHNAPAIEQGLIGIANHTVDSIYAGTCRALAQLYRDAALKVEGLGISEWPIQIVHADWHPGNMLFREGRVVAVIDYDSARFLPKIVDTANGALQFSIIGGDENVERWPEHVDESRFKRFMRGYDKVTLLSQVELQAAPWLMIEALIAEAVFPIAATGSFSRFEGSRFLTMVQRKTRWLSQYAGKLAALVAE